MAALRLLVAIAFGYIIGCGMMVLTTPKPERYDCHGMTLTACEHVFWDRHHDLLGG
jgi:hypothetical protein